MSESERKRRSEYRKRRAARMLIQAVILTFVALLAIGSFAAQTKIKNDSYVDSRETSSIDYRVYLLPNDFYDTPYLEGDRAYIASLIDKIMTSFKYQLYLDADHVEYQYSYYIDAQVETLDPISKKLLYSEKEVLKPEVTLSQNIDKTLTIHDHVYTDYAYFNEQANKFVNTYGLSDAQSTLVITMHVNVLSKCEAFVEDNRNSYTMSTRIPLTTTTADVRIAADTSVRETKVLACADKVLLTVLTVIFIVATVITVMLAGLLIAYAYLTRNHDINYSIKVKRLLSSYRSYIQKINNIFDTEGYQVLYVDTFNEMLNIRDTIQSPILMSENTDRTCTHFLIPTNTKILYVFELKVDDYDEIYGTDPQTHDLEREFYATEEPEVEVEIEMETPEETTDEIENEEQEPEFDATLTEIPYTQETEAIIVEKNADMEAVAEAMTSPEVFLTDIDFVDEIDEEYVATDEKPGVEVIGVVWPERAHKNKIYRYDPNGETLADGDEVLVPTRDASRDRDIVRKAAVAHGNHVVDPETLKYPLKKIIGVIRRTLVAPLEAQKENKADNSSEENTENNK